MKQIARKQTCYRVFYDSEERENQICSLQAVVVVCGSSGNTFIDVNKFIKDLTKPNNSCKVSCQVI